MFLSTYCVAGKEVELELGNLASWTSVFPDLRQII